MKRFLPLSFALVTFWASALSARAATFTWSNSGTDWNTSADWGGTGFPSGPTDLALFNVAVTVNPNISSPVSFQRISGQVTSVGSFTISGTTMSLSGVGVTTSSAIFYNGSAVGNTLTINAPIVLSAANNATETFTANTANASITLNGQIASTNTVALSLAGPGTVNLNNSANSYTGGTLIGGGTTSFVSGGLGSVGNVSLNGGALKYATGNSQDISSRLANSTGAITIDPNGNNITYANSIGSSNSGGLTLTGAAGGSLTLSGSNSYLGNTSISGNQLLNIANAHALSGGNLVFSGSGGSFDNTSSGALTISNGLTLSGGSPTFVGTHDLTIGGTTTLSGAARTITVNGGNLTLSGNVVDDGSARSLTKAGAGALTLSGSNSFTGGFIMNSGTVNLNSAFALGSTGGINLNTAGVTIDNTSGSAVTLANNSAITLNSITFGGSNNLTLGTGAVTITTSRTITLNGTGSTLTFGGTLGNSAVGNVTLTANGAGNTLALGGLSLTNTSNTQTAINGSGNVTINGGVSDGLATSGTGSLVYGGSGVLSLNGVGTYHGSTSITSGVLKLGNAAALGNSSGLAISNGATLDLNGQNYSTPIGTSLAGTLTNSNAAAATYAGDIATASTMIINGTGDISLSGAVTGNNQFVKNGANTLSLTGTTSNISLSLVLNSGTVILGKTNSSAIRGAAGIVVNGGLLQLGGTGGDQIFDSSAVTLNSGTFDVNTRNETVAAVQIGTGTSNGAIIGSTGVLTSVAAIDARNGSSSAILGGSAGLTKTTNGIVTLSAANTYTGDTTVSAGTLIVSASGALSSGNINIAASGTVASTVDYNFSGNVVNNGILNSGSHAISFASGKTLSGNATLTGGGSFRVNGMMSPGNSPGLVTVNNTSLTMGATSTTVWELASLTDNSTGTPGTDWDAINLINGGSMNIESGAKLQISLFGISFDGSQSYWQTSHTYTLIEGTGLASGTYALIDNVFSDSNGTGTFTLNGNNIEYNFTTVPEPGSVALLLMGGGLAGLFLRQRKS